MLHRLFAILLASFVASGCSKYSFYDLAPAPNLYSQTGVHPFADVPDRLRTTSVEVLYVTDREPQPCTTAQTQCGCQVAYGWGRSRSLAYGTITVNLGRDMTWDELVEYSTHFEDSRKIPLSCAATRELGRFPPTPDGIVVHDDGTAIAPDVATERDRVDASLRDLLQERLAAAAEPDAYIFIHGYNSEFEWPAYVIAQIWHHMGRPGVPIAYSWPAGSAGLLRGYQYDRESGEFTILHLKRFLKLLGTVPNLRRVCIIAHSRGTDVLTTALRELTLECGSPRSATETLKLDTLVFAAADLDFEVITQRFAAEGLFELGKRQVFYVHDSDSALGMSTWLFSSGTRLGRLRPENLKEPGRQFLNAFDRVEFIDARIWTPSNFTHSYFYAHPAVLSDMILVLRDGRAAGAQHGRPLIHDPSGFWILPKGYPAEIQAPDSN